MLLVPWSGIVKSEIDTGQSCNVFWDLPNLYQLDSLFSWIDLRIHFLHQSTGHIWEGPGKNWGGMIQSKGVTLEKQDAWSSKVEWRGEGRSDAEYSHTCIMSHDCQCALPVRAEGKVCIARSWWAWWIDKVDTVIDCQTTVISKIKDKLDPVRSTLRLERLMKLCIGCVYDRSLHCVTSQHHQLMFGCPRSHFEWKLYSLHPKKIISQTTIVVQKWQAETMRFGELI